MTGAVRYIHPVPPLAQLEVLVVDCQATAAGPRGHLLELGWVRVRPTEAPDGQQCGPCGGLQVQARLIKLPERERIRPAVTRITGISDAMMRDGDRKSVV